MNNIGMSFTLCKDCGLSHPPIAPGTKCPMAKEKTNSGEEIKFEELFITLKNILTSQIKIKNIKDTKKLFGMIIVDIAKSIEEFKE